MIKHFSIVVLLLISIWQKPFAQPNCEAGNSFSQLDGNAVNATLAQSGDFWWNGVEGGYAVPGTDPMGNVNAIFAGGLWMAGYDDGGNLKLAASTDGMAVGNTDFYPGPLSPWGTITTEDCSNWDRFWKVERETLNAFIADAQDGEINDPIPLSILSWPGRGNPHFSSIMGFDLPTDGNIGFAPFFDVIGDGIYDPEEGDFPQIGLADQGVFWIINDAGNFHSEVEGSDIIRMQASILALTTNSNEESINQSTYYDILFSNHGLFHLTDVYFGLWIDPELGCPSDDYIGCLPEEGLAYIYNADAVDGSSDCSCPSGNNTFCEEIPLMGIQIAHCSLQAMMFDSNGELTLPPSGQQFGDTLVTPRFSTFSYYTEDTSNPPSGTSKPGTPEEYFNVLSGKWRDGTAITEGGNGYNTGGTVTKQAFSGNPDDPDAWSMCQENMPLEDYKMVIGNGPYNLEPGGAKRISFSVIHVPNVAHPCPSISDLVDAAGEVTWNYAGLSVGPPSITENPLSENLNFKTLPNPFTTETEIIFSDLANKVSTVKLFDISGQMLREYKDIKGDRLKIERGNLNSGMYFYKLTTVDQQYTGGKLIVH